MRGAGCGKVAPLVRRIFLWGLCTGGDKKLFSNNFTPKAVRDSALQKIGWRSQPYPTLTTYHFTLTTFYLILKTKN